MGRWKILGRWQILGRWKIFPATTALAAAVIATTMSLPVFARELQPLATAAPEQVGMSAERLGRITTVLKKEIADGKLPGAVVMVARKGRIVYSDAIGFQDKGANDVRCDLPHLLDDQAACLGGGDDA